MKLFLEKYYKETSSDDIASLLSELQFAASGQTADPAAWHAWIKCIEKAQDHKEIMVLRR